MKQTDPQLKFRVTLELRQRLEAAANAARRPLSSEIIDRLERSFSEDEVAGDERSRVAAERILRMDFKGHSSALPEVNDLRDEIEAIKKRLSKLEKRPQEA